MLEDETDAKALKLLDQIDLFLAKMNRPACFDADSQENAELQLELHFEALCSSLEVNGTHYPAGLTTFEFYARIAYLKKQTAAIKQLNPK